MKSKIFVLAALLWACGSAFADVTLGAEKSTPFDSGYTVFCSAGDCPAYVGSVIFRADPILEIAGDKNELLLGFCSATLISPTQILTSTHCIPARLQIEGASCEADLDIRFPKLSGLNAEKPVCDKIEKFQAIDKTADSEMDMEWAVISLKTPSRRPLAAMGPKPLPLGTQIHGYPVSYNPFFPTGEIQKVTCEVSELGYLFPQTFSATSALFYANSCSQNVIPGNSGTSFFDEGEKLVGMLSAITHQKFQSASAAQNEGSPLIMGTKSLCFPILGPTPESCKLNPNENAFASATIMTSTLQSFAESLKSNKIDSSLPNASQAIAWVAANEANVNAIFVDLYGDKSFTAAHDFFLDKNLPELARDLRLQVVEILGRVPVCIKKAALGGKRSVRDVMSYTVFSFADFEYYPYEDGKMYFRMLENMRLEVSAKRIDLPVVITKTPGILADNYLVEYQRKSDPFALTSAEQVLAQKVCEQEREQKVLACGADLACQNRKDVLIPSPICQKVYKKMGFSNYLKKFSFQLPSC